MAYINVYGWKSDQVIEWLKGELQLKPNRTAADGIFLKSLFLFINESQDLNA